MSGRSRKPRHIVTEALRVVTRRSSDHMAWEDAEVAQALRFIGEHAARSIRVPDLVQRLAVSRRSLEIRFRRLVGRSIQEEIQRVRLERARQLLIETDLALPAVAEASGFAAPSYLAQVFRKHFGLTPARYRRQARGQ